MQNSLVALNVENKPINALGSFAEGQQAGALAGFSKLKQTQATLETVGSAAMYALNGDPNGEVDPAKYTEVMDSLQKIGMDTSAYRDNPNFAKVAANAAITALDRLKLAQGDRDYDMLMARFQADLAQNATSNDFERQKIDIAERAASARDVPAGYQFDDNGGLVPITGGPADPANPLNRKKVSGANLSPTAQKELFEADEGVNSGEAVVSALDRAMELNDIAYSGPAAESRGYAGSLIGTERGVATEELKNLITTQALDQLKATFGSMPTEGERKILLEIQGSVNQAPAVRKKIYERAKAMAKRRIAFSKKKADNLRSGDYFTEEGADIGAPELIDSGAEDVTIEEID